MTHPIGQSTIQVGSEIRPFPPQRNEQIGKLMRDLCAYAPFVQNLRDRDITHIQYACVEQQGNALLLSVSPDLPGTPDQQLLTYVLSPNGDFLLYQAARFFAGYGDKPPAFTNESEPIKKVDPPEIEKEEEEEPRPTTPLIQVQSPEPTDSAIVALAKEQTKQMEAMCQTMRQAIESLSSVVHCPYSHEREKQLKKIKKTLTEKFPHSATPHSTGKKQPDLASSPSSEESSKGGTPFFSVVNTPELISSKRKSHEDEEKPHEESVHKRDPTRTITLAPAIGHMNFLGQEEE